MSAEPTAGPWPRATRELLRVALGLRVMWVFLMVEVSLHRDALPRTCERMRIALEGESQTTPTQQTTVDPLRARRIRRSMRAVAALAPSWPGGDTCLRRCLVLGSLLSDLDPSLALGVRRDDQGAITAHSWLLIDGWSLDPTSNDYGRLAA